MAQYKVLESENIYILANKLYGSLEYVFKLAIDNDIVDITSDLSGLTLVYDETIKPLNSQPLDLKETLNISKMRSYNVMQKQSIFDLVLNTTGDFETLVNFTVTNNIQDISNIGDLETVNYTVTNNAFREWAIKNKKQFSTGLYPSEQRLGSFDIGFDQQSYL